MNLHPHRVRYWLHSPEKTEDPESFARKVNEICGLYQSAQEQSREGAHIVSTDEMTWVQALERKYPDKRPLPGQCARMEFEYIRHGTTRAIGEKLFTNSGKKRYNESEVKKYVKH